MEEKTQGQLLYEQLSKKYENSWTKAAATQENIFSFSEGYKLYLNNAKTERLFVKEAKAKAEAAGYKNLDDLLNTGHKLNSGDRVFQVVHQKAILLAVIGQRPVLEGVNVLGAHVDAPRIDLKQIPIYEDTEMVMFKTHYYGGIKKYQWVTIPLSMIGVVVKEDGTSVEISIGEEEGDPVFTITDLLPHLAQDQMQKKMSEAIAGEALNILVGSIPYTDDKVKDKVKLNVLKLIHDKYGITEEDFVSAELEIVPSFKARDVGIDRSFVGSYGQDDRVCAYSSLKAVMDVTEVEKTAVVILTDKEEIGSVGNTGAESNLFENFIARLLSLQNEKYQDTLLRTCLERSKMLSADVNAGVDPNYEGVQDKRNASFMGKGIVLQKYTGARGKSGASDANPEFIAEVRAIFNRNHIDWQPAELGKVDQGGGGTIALYMANLGMQVLDCGVAILSMHSPFEVTSKVDIYTMYQAYLAFVREAK